MRKVRRLKKSRKPHKQSHSSVEIDPNPNPNDGVMSGIENGISFK